MKTDCGGLEKVIWTDETKIHRIGQMERLISGKKKGGTLSDRKHHLLSNMRGGTHVGLIWGNGVESS